MFKPPASLFLSLLSLPCDFLSPLIGLTSFLTTASFPPDFFPYVFANNSPLDPLDPFPFPSISFYAANITGLILLCLLCLHLDP